MSKPISLLDAINCLNESDKRLELEEKEPKETSTINGIDKQENTNVSICFTYINETLFKYISNKFFLPIKTYFR